MKMADMDITSKVKLDDKKEKVIINSEVIEELTKGEFIDIFQKHNLEHDSLENQLHALNEQLINLDEIEETDELKHFHAMMTKVTVFAKREQVKKEIEKLKEKLTKKKRQLKQFEEMYNKLKDE
jgi:hypothetical protein